MQFAVRILVMLATTCLLLPGAGAQDWRAALENEKAKNARRITAIKTEGAPVARAFRAAAAAIDTHNVNPPDARSESAVNAYNTRAESLQTKYDALQSRLQTLVNEENRLTARNQEIDRKLNCLQLPIECTQNSDCECSNNCGNLGIVGGDDMYRCQPRR